MTNDDTGRLPVDGPPPAPVNGTQADGVNGARAWATTQPVVPAAPSPYGPTAAGQPEPVHPEPVQPARPEVAWADAEHDPWIDVTPPRPGEAPAFGAPAPRRAGQVPRVLGVIGLVAAGAVVGAVIVNAVEGSSANTAAVQPGAVSQNGTGANGGAPGAGVPGAGQGGAQGGAQGGVQGVAPGGGPGGGPGQGLGGGFGGQDGEQRLTGTLTAVSGSRLTVKTSSGSATYQVVPQTQIVRNGAPASASDLKTGDRVLVHVFPASGSDGVLERVIAVTGGRTGTGTAGGGADDTATADT